MQDDHITKRETRIGRWVPAAFYAINLVGWFFTAATAGAWDLLWLVLIPLLPLVMYLARTRRSAA
jgi:hypothetical protein